MELWFGDRFSLDSYVTAWREGLTMGDLFEEAPPLLNIQGSIGFIDIKGSLSNNSWFATTYTDIRNALVQAANTPDIEKIVLSIDSPGGSVSGLFDVASLIRYVNDNVKPVYTHSAGSMTSAAYALGSAAGEVYASPSASVGSVGVMAVHFDASKYYAEKGLTPTVFFSGEEKAVGNEYEPLTDKAKAIMQNRLDTTYGLFIDHVATRRGASPAHVRSQMAEGRVFTGKEAITPGLLDGVLTLDELVQTLSSQPRKEKTVATKRLPAHTVAAIAAGIPVDAAVAQLETQLETPENGQKEVPSQEAVNAEAQAPAVAHSGAAPQTLESHSEPSAADRLQVLLENKLVELAELKAENTRLKTDNTQFQANETALREVVHARMNHLEVALRCAPTDKAILSGLSTSVLLAQHASLQARLEHAYPVGGVTKLASTQQDESSAMADAALMKAVTF